MEFFSSFRRAIPACLNASIAVAALAPSSASAQSIIAGIAPASIASLVGTSCNSTSTLAIKTAPVQTAPASTIAPPRVSKMSAVLGGEVSALERIRLEQEAATTPLQIATAEIGLQETLSPAAGGVNPSETKPETGIGEKKTCFVAPQFAGANASGGFFDPAKPFQADAVTMPLPIPAPNDDFLASKRVRIGKTHFDREWRRVRSESLRRTLKKQFGSNISADQALIEKVNRWVNSRISYVEDRDLYNKADYWAGAKKTLLLGKGDCEDYALTKMQLLAAAGISRSDMFLTIARDRVRNADHALLIVKHAGRYLVLDNNTDKLLDGAYSHDFAPVLSFNNRKAWLHGY